MSKIQWCTRTWNPMIGCTLVVSRDAAGKRVPSGCDHCYAEGQVHRFGKRYDRPTTIKIGAKAREGLTFLPTDPATGKALGKGAKWTGAVWLLPDVLDEPLRRRKPTTYFVNSLSDVFHESVIGCEDGRRFVAAMFGVMAATPWHTYQILTKRDPREWFAWMADRPAGCFDGWIPDGPHQLARASARTMLASQAHRTRMLTDSTVWPLPNVWIGTSISTQADADKRIPALLDTPAAVRFISAEPLLGPVDLRALRDGSWHDKEGADLYDAITGHAYWSNGDAGIGGGPRLDWVISGGESGPKARPCEIGWIRDLVRQCRAAGVAPFVKQLGSRPVFGDGFAPVQSMNDAKGGDMESWPADLRVRELPEVSR